MEKIIHKYLNDPDSCPFCESSDITSDITGDEPEFISDTIYRNVKCNSCDKRWTEVFNLVSIIF